MIRRLTLPLMSTSVAILSALMYFNFTRSYYLDMIGIIFVIVTIFVVEDGNVNR